MNGRLIILLTLAAAVLAVVLCAGPVTAQQGTATGSGDGAPAAHVAAAPPDAEAGAQAADDDDDEAAKQAETLRRVLSLSRQYLVTIATRWRKDQGELPERGYRDSLKYPIGELVDDKRSSEELGVLFDPSTGLIVAEDHAKESRFIESVKGYTATGREFALARHGFFVDVDAAAYTTEAWPGPKEPLRWLEGPLDLFGGPGMGAALVREGRGWRLNISVGSGNGTVSQATDHDEMDQLITEAGTGLVFDADGRPTGFTTGARVSLADKRYPWRGVDLRGARLMTCERFKKIAADMEKQIGDYAHEVKIVYRQPEGDEENVEFEGEDRSSLIQYYYGYAISPTRVFVPVKLEKIYIQRFKKITVRFDGREVPAKFLGAYLDFGGFVVEMTEGSSPGVLEVAAGVPVPDFNRAVVTYLHERKFGRRRNIIWYNRIADYSRGHKDRLWPEAKSSLARGTLILDFDRKAVGLCLIERRLEQEKRGEDSRWRYYYRRGGSGALKLYHLDQLAEAFQKPHDHFDPNLKPASEQEEKRLVWLGVETQNVDSRLAEMLDSMAGSDQIQKWTRKGEVGLRVTYIHKDSPAAKAGIVEGDILLEITEEGKTQPIEFEPEGGSRRSSYGMWRGSRSRSYSMGGDGGRRNYLTGLLTRLGPGTKIALAYLDGAERKTREFTLEWAPYDFQSADKFKDEKTGLTVKNLTYDVRALLRLDDDQPGVIVAKVEDGEKADIAQISPHQIITEINGQPVRSVEEYQERMTAVQQAEAGGTAVFTLLWMGKSRIVKIEFP